MKRLRILYVTPELWLEMLKAGEHYVRAISGTLPDDTQFVRAFTDDRYSGPRIGMVISSEEFAPVLEGNAIPEHPPVTWRDLKPAFDEARRLIGEHHACGAMDKIRPGGECPVCAKHRDKIELVFGGVAK